MSSSYPICPDAQSPELEVECTVSSTLPTPSSGGELAFTGFEPWLFWLAVALLAAGLVVATAEWAWARWHR